MNPLRHRLTLLCLVPALALSRPVRARANYPGGIGSGGGDVIQMMLAVTRTSLGETLERIVAGEGTESLCRCEDEDDASPLCRYLMKNLTTEGRDYCRKFILATSKSMRALVNDVSIHLVPVPGPLFVSGPDGKPMPVVAKTHLEETGNIRFVADAVRAIGSPVRLLALLGHEFGHKVLFGPTPHHIDDNSPVGPFTERGGGRHLLDAVGVGLARYAQTKRLTGEYFGIEDKFSCTISQFGEPVALVDTHGGSPRWKSEDGRAFDTGVGNRPNDFVCRLPGEHSELYFRLAIHEALGCRPGATPEQRWSRAELWRMSFPTPDGVTPPPQLLDALPMPGVDPTCDGGERDSSFHLDFPRDKPRYRFEVHYEGAGIMIGSYRRY